MSVVNEAIEYRITECGIGHQLMPVGMRVLAGDDGGVDVVSVFEYIQEIDLLSVVEFCESPVIDNENVRFGDCVDEFRVSPISLGNSEVLKKTLENGFARVVCGKCKAEFLVG